MFERVAIDPNILHGEPRFTLSSHHPTWAWIITSAGMTVEEIIQEYPDLEPEDIAAALDYAAFVTREQVIPIEILRVPA